MRKKLYLINRHFQFRFMWLAVTVGLFSTVLTTVIILYPLFVFRILRIPEFLPLPILGVMALAALVNIALISYLTITVTHRVVGPLYNLVRNMRRFESPHWNGHIRVREKDELQYVMRNFNSMVDNIVTAVNKDLAVLEKSNENSKEIKILTKSLQKRTEEFRSLHTEEASS